MWTGSAWTNIRLRKKAVKRGWKLSQHGLFEGEVNLAANKTEEEIFGLLEATYVEPTKR